MTLRTYFVALLLGSSAAASAAPADPALNICYVDGYYQSVLATNPGNRVFGFLADTATFARIGKGEQFGNSPACLAAYKNGMQIGAVLNVPLASRNAEDQRVISLAQSFQTQVYARLTGNLSGF